MICTRHTPLKNETLIGCCSISCETVVEGVVSCDNMFVTSETFFCSIFRIVVIDNLFIQMILVVKRDHFTVQ